MTKEKVCSEVNINILKNIPYLRKKYQLSKKEFAKKLHVSVYTINLIETGSMPERLTANIVLYAHEEFGVWISEPLDEIFKTACIECRKAVFRTYKTRCIELCTIHFRYHSDRQEYHRRFLECFGLLLPSPPFG